MTNTQRKKLLKALLSPILLNLLSEKPRHGYALMCVIRKRYGVTFGPSTIYPLLWSLQKQNLLICNQIIMNGKMRKTYMLNTKGTNELYTYNTEMKLLFAVQDVHTVQITNR